ncbi:MAG: PAS domain S-box protein [Desulfarculus sp.]|nr:PAS domain S-box protein [Desulfarculus sp.]
MKSKIQDGAPQATELRRRAEERFASKEMAAGPPLTEGDSIRLLHELQVHQIELEMQNEELRQTQVDLEASQEKYFKLYNLTPVGNFTIDGLGNILEANLFGAGLLGTDRSQLISKRFDLFLTLESRPIFKDCLGRICAEASKQFCEAALARQGDGPRYVHIDCVAAEAEQGGNRQFYLAMLDISRRKQAEQRLKAAADEWQNTFDAMGHAVWVLDEQCVIQRANKLTIKLLGKQPEEIIGRHCWEVVHGTSKPLPDCPVLRMRQSKQRETMVIAQGSRWFAITVDPILDDNGNIIKVIHSLADITERKLAEDDKVRLEAKFQEAQRMQAIVTMAGGIAHDFNNILAIIMGFTDLAREQVRQGKVNDYVLTRIAEGADRASTLVKQIQTFSGKVETKDLPLNLNEVVGNILGLLELGLPSMIKTEPILAPNLQMVIGDPDQMEEVIMNLLSNARDAMPDGGNLIVETSNVTLDEGFCRQHPEMRPGSYVLLQVVDTGQGMDQPTMEKIFNPFFTTKEVGKGTGLGLSTTFGIVKAHQGHIHCFSKPGEGTTLKIYLPVYQAKQ